MLLEVPKNKNGTNWLETLLKKIIFSLFINFLLLFSSFSFEKLEIFYKQVNLKQYSFYVTSIFVLIKSP